MGCQQSRSSSATTSNTVGKHDDDMKRIATNPTKDTTTVVSPITATATTTSQSSSNQQSKKKKKVKVEKQKQIRNGKVAQQQQQEVTTGKNTPATNESSSLPQQQQQRQESVTTTTTTPSKFRSPLKTKKTPSTTTTTTTTKSIQHKSSDKVYKLLLKSLVQLQSQQKKKSSVQDVMKNNKKNTQNDSKTSTGTSLLLDTTSTTTNEKAILEASKSPTYASYQHPTTQSTPLHLAVQLFHSHSISFVEKHEKENTASTTATQQLQQQHHKKEYYETHSSLYQIIKELVTAYPTALSTPDKDGYIPLHYVIAPYYSTSVPTTTTTTTTTKNNNNSKNKTPTKKEKGDEKVVDEIESTVIILPAYVYPLRTLIVKLLLIHDMTTTSYEYLLQNNITYQSYPIHYGCTPLYRIVQLLPHDPSVQYSPILEYIHMIIKYIISRTSIVPIPKQQQKPYLQGSSMANGNDVFLYGTPIIGIGNSYDGDKVMALLYRIFTKQFDLSEQFFTGDNSRPDVIQHRTYYKRSANTTWKLIELLFKYQQHSIFGNNSNTSNTSSNTVQPPREELSSATNNGVNCTTIAVMDPCTTVVNQLQTQAPTQQQYLKPTYRIVHRAVQGCYPIVVPTSSDTQYGSSGGCQTPPDLLRYIIETNADQLTIRDELGNLPIHYAAAAAAAAAVSSSNDTTSSITMKKSFFPSFYNKYIIDELLYKYPESASIVDGSGNYPLTIAIQSGGYKSILGSGIKSLYDTYPDAIQQINIQSYPSLQRTLLSPDTELLTTANNDDNYNLDNYNEEKKVSSTKSTSSVQQMQKQDDRDNDQYDAILLVQNENVHISEVVISMWAHEEDAGVQLLGCIAIVRLLSTPVTNNNDNNMEHILRIALSAVPAVVNAMKAHPNEAIVQEKACHTLRIMACTDGQRDVSFVASGAVAAIVGAMQAHVSDPSVQEEASSALGQILHYGGSERATVISSVSGVTALLNAIAAHPNVVNVQYEVCNTLYELMNYKSTAYISELPLSQIETLLEYAKNHYPNECSSIVDQLLLRLT